MISLDPAERPTFDTLLHTSRGTVFPECFYSFLHNYVSSINELSNETLAVNNPQAVSPHPSVAGTVRPSTSSPLSAVNEVKTDLLPSDSDHRLERIWADYESIEPYITPESNPPPEAPVKVEYMPSVSSASKPYQVTFHLCKRVQLQLIIGIRISYLLSSTYLIANQVCSLRITADSQPPKVSQYIYLVED